MFNSIGNFLAAALILLAPFVGQDQKPAPAPASQQQAAPAPQAPAPDNAAPALDPVLKGDIAVLQRDIDGINLQLTQVQNYGQQLMAQRDQKNADLAKKITEANAKFPGFQLNADTLKYEAVKTSPAPPAPVKATEPPKK